MVGVFVAVGAAGAGAVASSNAAKGWESLAWLAVSACTRCEDAKECVALTSDAILGTVEPLRSR